MKTDRSGYRSPMAVVAATIAVPLTAVSVMVALTVALAFVVTMALAVAVTMAVAFAVGIALAAAFILFGLLGMVLAIPCVTMYNAAR